MVSYPIGLNALKIMKYEIRLEYGIDSAILTQKNKAELRYNNLLAVSE